LNREVFASLAEARVIIESWRNEYNHSRPHSALGYLTPQEFAAQKTTQEIATAPKASSKDKPWASITAAPTRDLPTIAFFRTVELLRRHGPVPGILAVRRPGRLWISLDPEHQPPFNPKQNKANTQNYTLDCPAKRVTPI
jgi:hypothetical protein